MAVRLSLGSDPAWLDLPHGVRVFAPPLNVAAARAAEYLSAKAYAAAKATLSLDDGVEATDEQAAVLEGVYTQSIARAYAEKITAWTGIEGDAGEPMSVTKESLDAFAAHPVLGPAFRRAYDAPALALVTEGNGSAAAGSGSSPAAPHTAGTAPPSAPPARGSSRPPKPNPARP